jgi:hypothetical protein
MREERLERFAVVFGGADAAEAGNAQGDGHRQGAPAAVVHPRDLADDLVDGGVGEAVELDFGDGMEAGNRQAHGHPEDAGLRQRRAEDALLAVLCLQAVRDPEHSAEPAAVLATLCRFQAGSFAICTVRVAVGLCALAQLAGI